MATWKDISDYKKTYYGEEKASYTHDATSRVHVRLQYDADSTTPESITLRFKYTADAGLSDKFDILLNPESSSRKLLHLKTSTSYDKGPFYSGSFTLSKTYTAEKFSLPAYWICNLGSSRTMSSAADCYEQYSYSNWLGKVMRETVAAASIGIATDKTTTQAGGNPTVDVVCSTDTTNRVIISTTTGKAYTNNALKSFTVYYTTDGTDPSSSSSRSSFSPSSSPYKKNIDLTNASTKKVRAYAVCTFKYNTTTASKECDVVCYKAPAAPGTPSISYSKSRLTIKEDWSYTWSAAKPGDATTSPIKGYRIRLYKNGTAVTGLTCSTSNNTLGKGTGTNNYVDRESTSCKVTFDPTTFGFVAGDEVKLGIYAYTRDNTYVKGKQLFSAQVFSNTDEVKNAGIVNVKVGGTWKEGQVYVKVDNKWKEAESVHTKVSGAWKESQ